MNQTSNFLETLHQNPPLWLSESSTVNQIIFSTRIRLARNLKGFSFPPSASATQAEAVLEKFEAVRGKIALFKRAVPVRIDEVDSLLAETLCERHLISLQFIKSTLPRLALIEPSEQFCILVNEEDHLRIQSMRSGLDFEAAWRQVSWIDGELAKLLDYAQSERFGHHTACPTNTGTGLRASIQIHLPGLVLSDGIRQMKKNYPEYQVAFRGVSGEGSRADGNIFQVSNQRTLGQSESEILKRLSKAAQDFVSRELEARRFLFQTKRDFISDKIFRALAALQNARIISLEEFFERLSMVRLGLDSGMIQGADHVLLNKLMILSNRAHLCKNYGVADETDDGVDAMRANFARSVFASVVCRERIN